MPRRIAYLINPAAAGGRARRRWSVWARHLAKRGLGGEVHWTAGPNSAGPLAADLGRHHDVVVVAGGDGTVMEAVAGLALPDGPGAALAVLPLGSGNDAAQSLGAGSVEGALATLERGTVRHLDLIEVSCRDNQGRPVERLALDLAGAALVAEVLRLTPSAWKPYGGARLAYAAGFFRALLRFKPARLSVRCDDWSVSAPLVAVIVANQATSGGGGMRTGPGARPDDGWLNVSVIRAVGRLALARQFLGLVRGTHIRHPAVDYRPARDITLAADEPVGIGADGDVLGFTPARFRIRPASLPVLAGPGSTI